MTRQFPTTCGSPTWKRTAANSSRRIVLTHLSADLLASQDELAFETAYDGLAITL